MAGNAFLPKWALGVIVVILAVADAVVFAFVPDTIQGTNATAFFGDVTILAGVLIGFESILAGGNLQTFADLKRRLRSNDMKNPELRQGFQSGVFDICVLVVLALTAVSSLVLAVNQGGSVAKIIVLEPISLLLASLILIAYRIVRELYSLPT